jgi:hypothetical protein
MRGVRLGLQWIATFLVGLAGCHMPENGLKHPLREEYVLPPADDPRFSQPPQFPKEVLDTDLMKKPQPKPGDQMGGPPKFGAGGPGGGY